MTHTTAILAGVKRWVQHAEHSLEDPVYEIIVISKLKHKKRSKQVLIKRRYNLEKREKTEAFQHMVGNLSNARKNLLSTLYNEGQRYLSRLETSFC